MNHPQQVALWGVHDDTDDRRTLPDLLRECMALAGVDAFDLDAAATVGSAKAPRWFDRETDGLRQPWSGRVWCNPPFSACGPWAVKAGAEAERCQVVALLLPANRTEQGWWQQSIEPDRRAGRLAVYFLAGRRRFEHPSGWQTPAKGDHPPFGVCLVVWSRGEA
jgi:hypothetical protein